MTRQIGLQFVPNLTARLNAISTILERESYIEHILDVSQILFREYFKNANGITSVNFSGEPVLATSLEKFWRRFEEDYPKAGVEGVVRDVYDHLDVLNKTDYCGLCLPGVPCTGIDSVKDSVQIEAVGRCLSIFRKLCAWCLRWTLTFYRSYLGKNFTYKPIRFITGHENKRNPILDVAFHTSVSESYDFLDSRDVLVSFFVSEFDFSDFEQLLYGIFHECFVHGMCGVPLKSRSASASDIFHEGWMDYVGYSLLNWRLERDVLARRLISKNRSRFILGSEEIHRRRVKISTNCHPAMRLNSRGKNAAIRFLSLCATILGPEVGRAEAIRFSLALNASEVSDTERGEFVGRVYSRLTGDNAQRRAFADQQLASAVQNFARNGDIQEILAAFM